MHLISLTEVIEPAESNSRQNTLMIYINSKTNKFNRTDASQTHMVWKNPKI